MDPKVVEGLTQWDGWHGEKTTPAEEEAVDPLDEEASVIAAHA
jgi:hypothetical protein